MREADAAAARRRCTAARNCLRKKYGAGQRQLERLDLGGRVDHHQPEHRDQQADRRGSGSTRSAAGPRPAAHACGARRTGLSRGGRGGAGLRTRDGPLNGRPTGTATGHQQAPAATDAEREAPLQGRGELRDQPATAPQPTNRRLATSDRHASLQGSRRHRGRRPTVRPRSEFANGLRERVTALVVVGEHVHGGTGRGQQHRVARPRPAARASWTAASIAPVSVRSRSTTGTSGACRARASPISARSAPISTTPRSRFADLATSSSKVAPLASPPAIQTIDSYAAKEASAACVLVALESST